MSYVVAAVVVGVVVGYLRRGRLSTLATQSLRWWPLLAVAGVVQVTAIFVSGDAGVVALLASFALLISFTAMNLTRSGMGIVLIGVALNAIVIGANGGMPVRDDAIIAAGIADRDEFDDLDFNAKWHLETDDDRFTVLGDIIPVPGVREVLSFGDLVMAVGVADVIVHLMTARGGAVRRPEQEASASTGTD